MSCPKAFTEPMAAGYEPKDVEASWYDWWEKSDFFKPKKNEGDDRTPFTVVLPPPNVTGYLHLGHALTGAVQDTICRFQRMDGREVLYLPGTDHAGIATQVVVEKRLTKETGKSRHDLGREAFLEKVWEFKGKHEHVIHKQLRMIGSSLDWSRERFTMDEHCAKSVTEAFVRLHEDGKLYRATRLVNWCCALQSAISDLEVEFDDVPKEAKVRVPGYERVVQMGRLTHVAYKVVGSDSDEELVFATTRPETMLGDSALAIHPEDARYKKFHGKKVWHPFRECEIPIILDATLVDMAFGTGVVKVTPAHDPNDFETGKRHNLESVVVLDLKGHIALEGAYKGMHRFDARYAVCEFLEKQGLLRGTEGHEYRVGRCSRTNDIIEPMLMPQWFVDTDDMAEKALQAVEKKELVLIPDSHESTWRHFLGQKKPWCISRQLWWGHRVPAYEAALNGARVDQQDSWIVARDVDEARKKAQAKWSLSDEDTAKLEFTQDPDVLDTWFSSGLWPFSTMGWPNMDSEDFTKYFPNSLLETGHDILFFWVARMVMMSLHFTGKLPFKEVFLHAMVRDKDGQKMSKSKGNVIDPIDVINGVSLETLHETVRAGNLAEAEVERAIKYQKKAFKDGIPICGSDALRFGLLSYTQSGKSVNLDTDRIVGYRQFCNKLWNVTRFVLYHGLGEEFQPTMKVDELARDSLPLDCAWILSRLDQAVEDCRRGMQETTYDFALATNAAYRFFLYELCDVFLELTKPIMATDSERKTLTQNVLVHVVEKALRMLHPMMPFVTEELWHRMPHYKTFTAPSIMVAPYPKAAGWRSEKVEADMKVVMDTVHTLRSVKAEYQLTNKNKPDIWLVATQHKQLLANETLAVATLAVVGDVVVVAKEQESEVPEGCGFTTVNPDVGAHMMLKGIIDVAAEVKKMDKKAGLIEKSLTSLETKMKAPTYEQKVPEAVRATNTEKAAALRLELTQLVEAKSRLEKMK